MWPIHTVRKYIHNYVNKYTYVCTYPYVHLCTLYMYVQCVWMHVMYRSYVHMYVCMYSLYVRMYVQYAFPVHSNRTKNISVPAHYIPVLELELKLKK